MKEQLEKIKQEALAALAVTKESVDLEALRVKYLGKRENSPAVLKQMGKLSAEERPVIGQLANEVRERLTAEIDAQKKKIEEIKLEARLEAEAVDVTIPGQRTKLGTSAPHVYCPGRNQGHFCRDGLYHSGWPGSGIGILQF